MSLSISPSVPPVPPPPPIPPQAITTGPAGFSHSRFRVAPQVIDLTSPEPEPSPRSPVMRGLTPPPSETPLPLTAPSTPSQLPSSIVGSADVTPSGSRLTIKLPARKKTDDSLPTEPTLLPGTVRGSTEIDFVSSYIDSIVMLQRVCESPGCGRAVPSDSTAPRCDACSLKRWRDWAKGGTPTKADSPRRSDGSRKGRHAVGKKRGSDTPVISNTAVEEARGASSSSSRAPGDILAETSPALTDVANPSSTAASNFLTSFASGQNTAPAALTTVDHLDLDLDDLGELCYPDEEPIDGPSLADNMSSVPASASAGAAAVTVVTDGMDVEDPLSSDRLTQPVDPDPSPVSWAEPPPGGSEDPVDNINDPLSAPLSGDELSDLSELTPIEESTDSGEPSESEGGEAGERVCGHSACGNLLPLGGRWKLCAPCRERNRLDRRQRVGWAAQKDTLGLDDDKPAHATSLNVSVSLWLS
ncbi:hypothetical protein OE88DRAFT_929294 [Heliocybe sulcata]|uniref:Uncharacterized protein n=1 Tax=Heliocybe sulcata TaxID=5364 RepID=A0A5C3MLX4_9AGAM|nr:hypothetical protein OE88DRAFT_929294 [Heliocybe sulcata]